MDTIAARIDALFAPWSKPGSPGAVWSVTRHGETIHSGAVTILANLDAIAPYSLALRMADIVLAGEMEPVPDGGPALTAGLYRTADGEVLGIGPAGELITEGGSVASPTR